MMRAISYGIRSYPTLGTEKPYDSPLYMHVLVECSVNKVHTAVLLSALEHTG